MARIGKHLLPRSLSNAVYSGGDLSYRLLRTNGSLIQSSGASSCYHDFIYPYSPPIEAAVLHIVCVSSTSPCFGQSLQSCRYYSSPSTTYASSLEIITGALTAALFVCIVAMMSFGCCMGWFTLQTCGFAPKVRIVPTAFDRSDPSPQNLEERRVQSHEPHDSSSVSTGEGFQRPVVAHAFLGSPRGLPVAEIAPILPHQATQVVILGTSSSPQERLTY